MDDLKGKLFDCFIAADKTTAINFVEKLAEKSSYEKVFCDIVEPALAKFGKKWAASDDVNLAQGYIAAKITEEIMKRLNDERNKKNIEFKSKGIAVLGNIEDDYHSLGRKMVVNFLKSAGWVVYDLGNDVLAEEFVDKAVEVNASVIGASAMMYSNVKNMHKLRMELDRRGLNGKIKFAVGGAIFNLRPELVEEIKADGTARNALEVIELFDRLSKG